MPNVQHELHPRTSCVDIWCNRATNHASTTNHEWRALIGTEVGLTNDKDGEEDSGGYWEGDSYGSEDELQEVFVMNAIYCHQQFHLQYYKYMICNTGPHLNTDVQQQGDVDVGCPPLPNNLVIFTIRWEILDFRGRGKSAPCPVGEQLL